MLYQFLPRLSDDEYAALEKSIREHGVQVPIVVDENRSIIDGHHRKEIADRLGIDCPRRFAMDLDDTQKRTLALSLNLDRRHLSREQKRELIAKSLKADPQLSNRQHAERVGASPTTVGNLRSTLEEVGELSKLDSRLSADGRERPATRPTPAADYVTDQADLDAAAQEPAEDSRGAATSPDRAIGDGGPTSEAVTGAAVEQTPEPSPAPARPVTGLDGKTYTRREPAKPKRRPLIDAFGEKRWDTQKAVESLHRLTQDDRFTPNAEKVATANRSDLLRTRDLLTQVIESLPEIY